MIFVDTSAFLAIENRRDKYHKQAVVLRDSLLKAGKILVASDYVLDESYTVIRFRAGHHILALCEPPATFSVSSSVSGTERITHSAFTWMRPAEPEACQGEKEIGAIFSS